MNLFDQISEDIKKAMLARNHAETEALRGVSGPGYFDVFIHIQ